ncbi:hypothetical protein [Bacteriovorax sp. Seq25_V]|uniref:hypothetical protein n=1 Tax=Bacteriovorax sp. Seq25_V TaxID=1201288 RepID=UPI0018DFA64B|nr:hypothetical protein [Bacteriovorax sp. Seq25_V]
MMTLVGLISTYSKAQFGNCQKSKIDMIEYQYEKVSQIAEKRDVSVQMRTMKYLVNSYCKDNKKILENLDQIEIQGHRNNIEFLAEEVKRVSKFRSPEEEIKSLKASYEKTKKYVSTNFDQLYLDGLIKEGKKNSKLKQKSCSAIENRKPPIAKLDKSGKVVENYMRDQDTIGWCYAFVAADLISSKIGQEVSAVDIAQTYNKGDIYELFGFEESEIESGLAVDAANLALEKGVCLENQVRSDDFAYSKNGGDLLEELKAIEKLYDQYYDRASYKKYFLSFKKEGKDLDKADTQFYKDLVCSKIDQEWRGIFPNISVETLVGIFSKASSSNKAIDALIEASCKKRIKPKQKLTLKEIRHHFRPDGEALMSELDKQLEKGDMVGVAYFSDILSDKYENADGRHASSIVARKFNEKTGSCEYLLRNSWGTDCYSYDDSYKCEDGNIWIPGEYMTQAIYGVQYYE